jgi:thiol-disulfide isomerase/thioredoxin
MRKSYGFLLFWIFIAGIAGCSSKKEDKKDESAAQETQAPVVPKNFERAVPPAMMTTPQERADYLVTHFWDKFNFSDTMYCHAPDITEQAFVDFIALFPHASSSKISEGVNKLLDAAEVENVMYTYFCSKAEHYLYNPNSPIRNDAYFIPFLEHIVNSSKVMDVHKIRPRHQLTLAYRNRIGFKAEDFTYTLASGKTGNLYGVSAKYVLLMFYNPDCVECRHTMEMLKNSTALTAGISSGKVKVVAVYPDENLEAWQRHVKDVPSAWINGYDKSLAVKNNEIYDLKAIPTLYLLDKDKKVILKDTSTADIHEYLEKNQ